MFDAAIPGSQPILSVDSLRLALVASLTLGCQISPITTFDRKHYFYPDLPAGYQITQHFAPIATNGKLWMSSEDGVDRDFAVRIKQVQLEQDTAKSYPDPLCPQQTLIDLNRSGVALVEIVTEPDLRTAKEASAFVRKLQSILRYAGVSKVNMEQGSLRCDVNVSVGCPTTGRQGVRCEIKNVNGFGHIEHAINHEVSRQIELVGRGGKVASETRGFDTSSRRTFRLRGKESALDYRYLPDADIPPVEIPATVVKSIKEILPEVPSEIRARLQDKYGLKSSTADILIMIASERVDDLVEVGCAVRYFEAAMSHGDRSVHGKMVADWIINELLGHLSRLNIPFVKCPVSPKSLMSIVSETVMGGLPRTTAREMLGRAISEPSCIDQLLGQLRKSEQDLRDEEKLVEEISLRLIKVMGKEVELIKAGKHQILGKLVGEGVRRSHGTKKVDPKQLKNCLVKLLGLDKDHLVQMGNAKSVSKSK